MNFWREKSLKVQAASILILLSLVFIAEYFAVRSSLHSLAESERKIDFARSVQVENQQVALQVTHYIKEKKDLRAEIAASLDQESDHLKTLGEGGRLEGSDDFLEPLSRLPAITHAHLMQTWGTYKSAITTLITGGEMVEQIPEDGHSQPSDSTMVLTSAPYRSSAITKATVTFESQWLSLSKWFEVLITDLEGDVGRKQSAVLNWFSLFIALDIGALYFLFQFFHRHVLLPLKEVEGNTAQLVHSRGLASNEVGAVAARINDTIEDLRDATEFVTAIGSGKLNIEYKSLDGQYTPGENKLADSLIEMQTHLKSMNEEERKRQWSNEGLAKFVDILRSSNDNLNTLGDKVIAALVQYTHSNQGGLYILNDDDAHNRHLELISLFAFDLKKFEQRKIKLGEGILGQTFLEKQTTYLANVPEEYVKITSGLGDANPKSILIVPLRVDTLVYGIIELASFNAYLPHEITFVEHLGESIASTLASVKAAQKNRQLIEQFQQQTEQMRAQEEEMRQNMEELQATQEEIARKEKSYIVRIQELEEQAGSGLPEELQEARLKADKKELELQHRIADLTQQLAQTPAHGDDWALAQEVGKALKINLEALQITKEELDRKAGQ